MIDKIATKFIEITLLDGSTLKIRPLTIAERRELAEKVPSTLLSAGNLEENPKLIEKYLDFERDVIHFIITRSNPEFKKEDIEKKLDSSLIEQILIKVLKDPFSELASW